MATDSTDQSGSKGEKARRNDGLEALFWHGEESWKISGQGFLDGLPMNRADDVKG
jgi:hypothetical protein